MKILVTGATGLIGDKIVPKLLEQNHQVIATGSSSDRLQDKKWKEEVQFKPYNILSNHLDINLFEYFEYPDKVLHLAWGELDNYHSERHLNEILPKHVDFLKNLISNGARDITVAGTCFEYGKQEGMLEESMATKPNTNYSIAKDKLRKELESFQKEIPFIMKWARLFYIYSYDLNQRGIFSYLDKAIANQEKSFNMSGGEQVRDYLLFETMVDYLSKLVVSDQAQGIYNISSNKPIKLVDLIREYLIHKGKQIDLNLGFYPYLDYEPMKFWGDNQKLNQILNLKTA